MEWLRIIVIGIKLLYLLMKAQRLSCHLAWRSVGLKGSVDGLRLSTPTNPQGAPPLGWRHDGVVCVVLEFQSGNAILAQVQGTCLD